VKNRIIFYSGGKSSFAVADWVKQNYPNDNIVLYFTDTMWEDEDLYRFIREGSDKLELPMLIHADGRNPKELMEEDNFLYNSRIANCSMKLKVQVSKRYIKKGIKPTIEEWYNKQYLKNEDFTKEPILYFGIGFQEAHRKGAIVKNWSPYQVEMPMVDSFIDVDKVLEKHNIKQPRLYDMRFSHNNCAGRCIKGGQGHWIHLLKKDPSKFMEMLDFENKMNEQINEYKGTKDVKYSFLKKKGNAWTLEDLKEDYEQQPEQIDLFDIGACGCFVDEEE
jgi:hypothetical protein